MLRWNQIRMLTVLRHPAADRVQLQLILRTALFLQQGLYRLLKRLGITALLAQPLPRGSHVRSESSSATGALIIGPAAFQILSSPKPCVFSTDKNGVRRSAS